MNGRTSEEPISSAEGRTGGEGREVESDDGWLPGGGPKDEGPYGELSYVFRSAKEPIRGVYRPEEFLTLRERDALRRSAPSETLGPPTAPLV